MKFVFPQNYNFNSKILGIFEYSSAILDLVWSVIVFGFVHLFLTSLNTKIFIFIILVFPVIIFSIVGINGENILYVFSYVIKFFFKQKILFYEKK